MKILIAVTADISIRLLSGQLDYLVREGFDVHLVVSPGKYANELENRAGFTVHYVEMARDISLKKDIRALFQMIRVFRKVRPDIANVGTPKAALLGSIAGFVTRTKRRIYTLRGLRIETTYGAKRFILKIMEQLTISLSTEVIAISPSLIAKCKELGLSGTAKMTVLGAGSSNGLQLAHFDKQCKASCTKPFSNNDFIVGFTGRITKDKGIEELVTAFMGMKNTNLLLVGGLDEGHGLKAETYALIQSNPRIKVTGFIANPAPYYQFMDVFVIPSYREGFSNVCLEAAAAKRAVIGTNVTGIKDAIVKGKTGSLVEPHSSDSLQQEMQRLQASPTLRASYAKNGRARVVEHFQAESMWGKMVDFYRKEN